MKRPVILIGMPGSGKSTVGRLLAAEIGVPFVDSDQVIEQRSGVTISEIFEAEGEAGFRARETAVLEELVAAGPSVIATGGGAIVSAHNRNLLHAGGFVVYLRVSPEEILRRTGRDTSRPLLAGDDREAKVRALLDARAPLYGVTADISFQCAAASPRRLVAKILAHPRLVAHVRGETA